MPPLPASDLRFFPSLVASHRFWTVLQALVALFAVFISYGLDMHVQRHMVMDKVLQTGAALFSLCCFWWGYRRYQDALGRLRNAILPPAPKAYAYRKIARQWWAINGAAALLSFIAFAYMHTTAFLLLGLLHTGMHFFSSPGKKMVQLLLQLSDSECQLLGL